MNLGASKVPRFPITRPRVEESGLGLMGGYGFSAPYEDLKLKSK